MLNDYHIAIYFVTKVYGINMFTVLNNIGFYYLTTIFMGQSLYTSAYCLLSNGPYPQLSHLYVGYISIKRYWQEISSGLCTAAPYLVQHLFAKLTMLYHP